MTGLSMTTTTDAVTDELAGLVLASVTSDLEGLVLGSSSRRILVNAHCWAGKTAAAVHLVAATAFDRPGSLVLVVVPNVRTASAFLGRLNRWRPDWDTRTALFPGGSRVTCVADDVDTVAGYSHPDVVVVDEAARVSDEVHDLLDSVCSRAGGGARLVKLSTPCGARGRFHADWTGGDDWERIELRASRNPRVDREWLAEMRRSHSERHYAQDFECEFLESTAMVA
jgi:hypothetical protein